MNIKFEQLEEKHREDVMNIYSYYSATTTSAFPINVDRNRIYDFFLLNSKKYPSYALIDEENKMVIGFCMLSSYMVHDCFKNTASTTYFIDSHYVGKGAGTKCLERLEDDAKAMGITKLIADISSENKTSIKFHERHGFNHCGELKNIGHKFNRDFGIILMQKEI